MKYGMGMGQDTSSIDLTGLVPDYAPDQSAPLNVGALASQVSSSGQYSLNPSTGQLQTNVLPGVTNSNLLLIAAAVVAGFFFLGALKGRR